MNLCTKQSKICSLFDIQSEEDLSSNRSDNNFNIANAAAISIEVTIRSQSKIFRPCKLYLIQKGQTPM
jgi:hypothetical protein